MPQARASEVQFRGFPRIFGFFVAKKQSRQNFFGQFFFAPKRKMHGRLTCAEKMRAAKPFLRRFFSSFSFFFSLFFFHPKNAHGKDFPVVFCIAKICAARRARNGFFCYKTKLETWLSKKKIMTACF